MKHSIIYYSLILMFFATLSCKKDKDLQIVEKYVIQGKILEDTINWRINNTTIQPVSAGPGRMMNFTEDENKVKSTFEYTHVNSKNPIAQIIIFSPAFNVKDSLSKNKALFSLGKKYFTNDSISKLAGFYVDVLYKEQGYSTRFGNQKNKTFEITKLEFLPDESDPENFIIARTSITLNCNLYDYNKNLVGEIKNLVMDAEFKLEKEK